MRIRVEVTGVDEVRRSLGAMGQAGRKVTKRVFGAFTERVAARARPLTPVEPEDGGELRDSVRATRPVETGNGVVSAGVVAGGAAMRGVPGGDVYPAIQHDDTTLKHTTGQAKFLATPFFAEVVKLPGELLDGLDQERDRVLGGR